MLSATGTEILAVGVLLGLAGGGLLWLVAHLRQTDHRVAQWTLAAPQMALARVLWRGEIRHELKLPLGQGAVVVGNHRSSIDPILIQSAVNRRIHWMVAKEYCQLPVVGAVLRLLDVIPVSRGGVDTAGTKMAVRCAEQGRLVGMFPEGRINTTGQFMLPGRPGAALVALKARVPIIPCYIEGTPYDGTAMGPLVMPAKARVTLGKPIDLSAWYDQVHDRQVLREVTLMAMKAIAHLAGDDQFEPHLAGRHWKTGNEEEEEDAQSAA